jgi:hypothetical protein
LQHIPGAVWEGCDSVGTNARNYPDFKQIGVGLARQIGTISATLSVGREVKMEIPVKGAVDEFSFENRRYRSGPVQSEG